MDLALAAVFCVALVAMAIALLGALRFADRMADRLMALRDVPASDAVARLRSVGHAPPPAAPEPRNVVPDLGPAGMWGVEHGKDFDRTGN